MSVRRVDSITQPNPANPPETSSFIERTGRALTHLVRRDRSASLDKERVSVLPLPDELYLLCFAHLQLEDFAKCLLVCKDFQRICEDTTLWEFLFQRQWNHTLEKGVPVDPKNVYRQLAKTVCQKGCVVLPEETLSAQLAGDNEFWLGSQDGTLSFLEPGGCREMLKLHSPIQFLQAQGLKVFLGTQDGYFGICDFTKGTPSIALSSEPDGEKIKAFSFSNSKVCLGYSDFIMIWDPENTSLITRLEQDPPLDEENFENNALHANATHLCTGLKNGQIEWWDLQQKKCVARFKGHDGAVDHVQLVGSTLYSRSKADATIKVWDLTTQQCLRTIAAEGGTRFQVLGPKLFYGTKGKLIILDLVTNRERHHFADPITDTPLNRLWILGAKVFAATDQQIYSFDFS